MPKPFRLWKRGRYFYFKLRGQKTWKTTGQTTENTAVDFILTQIRSHAIKLDVRPDTTVREYLKPYYTDSCPHVIRLRSEGKNITAAYMRACQSLIKNKIDPDPISNKKIHDLKRGDILDFRARLLTKNGPRIVNRTIQILKTAFKEGYFREELYRDPTAGIGDIRYEPKKSGVFTRKELRKLFPEEDLGPWGDLQEYVVFLLAATWGMRRGEILALKWKHIDFDKGKINIESAWKDWATLGKPKWEKTRIVPLTPNLTQALKRLRAESMHVLPESFVFCNSNGEQVKLYWVGNRFHAAMKRAGIDTKTRNLKPHSFRHSCATLLRDAGYSDAKIRALLGWSSEQIQDVYTHFDVEHFQDATGIVNGFFDEERGDV